MNWQKKPIFNVILTGIFFCFLGCGVKGDPLPPEKPPELGRGRPTYKRATEEITIEKTRARKAQPNTTEKGDGDDDDGD